jgi:YesN/AraC family two-component response regulator
MDNKQGTKNILIVEDEIIIGTLLKKVFENEGFTIAGIAPSGERAIEIAAVNKLDFVIMDIQLSGNLNGIDTSIVIRENQDTNIIFITGYSDMETQERVLRTNPAGFLLKPLDVNELLLLIRKLS